MPTTVGTTKRRGRIRGKRTTAPARRSPIARAVEGYIEGVLNGTVIAGELIRLAVKRHLLDLQKGKKRGLYFDEQKASDAIEFFSYLKHSKGEWAGQSFQLEPWQQFIVWVLFGWAKKDGTRRFKTAYLEVPRKNGKALDVETPVFTTQGWKRHGDLRIGDLVFSADGLPKKVLAVTSQYLGPCYRMAFSDGSVIVAHAKHEWQTRRTWHTGRPHGSRQPLPLVETEQVARTLRVGARGDFTHGIPVARPLQLPPAELAVPPYTLGAWLGDGHSASARLMCTETGIVERIAAEGVTVKKLTRLGYGLGGVGRGGSLAQKARSLQAKLASIGVLNNKHIPDAYLRASEKQRRALLAGLMDTDGHVTARGQCEIVLTHKPLFDGAIELLAGLGYKPTQTTDVATLNGRVIGPRYRVQFWARPEDEIVSLPRKTARMRAMSTRQPRCATRMVVDAQPIGERLVNCIEVEGGFYLAGRSMITTHNSTLGAGIGLKLAFADNEPGAEVYSAATKKDQAIIVHGEATRMVKASPDLVDAIQVYKNSLTRIDKAQKYEPLGADEDTLDGLNVHAAIVDELHAHKTRGVYDLMETGTSARRQPLLFAITTAGTDQTEASICWEQHVYVEQILRGVIQDDTYFGFICAMDEKDDWRSERNWYKANPNLGVSKKLDYMRDQAQKAANMPSKLNTFLRLDLNQWTQQVTRWIDLGLWDQNAGGPIDESTFKGRVCFAGLDLSSVSDLTAFVLLFPDAATGVASVLCRFWCPEARLTDEHNRYRDQYEAWARDGWITATPGNAIDYEAVKAQVLQDAQTFQMQELAVDRLFQGYQMSMQLAEEGLTVAACGMGFMSMAGPTAELERRLLSKGLRHGGNPVLRWMANNVAVKQDPAGNKKPDKAQSQGKIDGIVALLLALDRDMRHQTTPSIYESRGLTTLGGAADGGTTTT